MSIRLAFMDKPACSEGDAPLEFFATDAVVAGLESEHAAVVQSGRAGSQVLVSSALAWQLRQRDTKRALKIVDEVERLLAKSAGPETERRRYAARLQLIRAEARWLHAEHDAAQSMVQSVLEEFESLGGGPGDLLGCADSHWLLGKIALARGDSASSNAELERVIGLAAAVDPIRSMMAQATLARNAAYRDVACAKMRWQDAWPEELEGLHPAAAATVCDFRGNVEFRSSNYAQSIRYYSGTYHLALASGQLRSAIETATNIGASYSNLNHHAIGLEWMQRALDLARAAAWPGTIGLVLVQVAGVLREMQRLDAAADMLREALPLMSGESATRAYGSGLRYMADVELHRGQFDSALASFRALEQRAKALGQPDQLALALRGQASTLLEMGEAEQALMAAQAALEASKPDVFRQTIALRLMADIHARQRLPSPDDLRAPSVPLHYLLQALELALTIDGYTIPGELYESLAREYARLGNLGKAYELALQAMESKDKIRSAEASNRAVALQVSHETERACAEAEHARQLALVNAERASAMEQANRTLERLGDIGREITANLDADTIFAALDRHLHELLDAFSFVIYRLEPCSTCLTMMYGIEAGWPLPPHRVRLDDSASLVARCVRQQGAIASRQPDESASAPEASLMVAPLVAEGRTLGAMAVRSTRLNAYTERELSIFRALSAYAAISLVNAEVKFRLVVANAELESLSNHDRLTGLSNRQHLDHALQEEFQRSRRTGAQLSVIILDIDHFKAVNDTHGHQVGDQVLVALARLLLEESRATDLVGRWGGEEFMLVCRGTDLAGAAVLAEKLRARIAAETLAVVGAKTCSLGVACLSPEDGIEELVGRADAALYRAKNAGRNRVEGSS